MCFQPCGKHEWKVPTWQREVCEVIVFRDWSGRTCLAGTESLTWTLSSTSPVNWVRSCDLSLITRRQRPTTLILLCLSELAARFRNHVEGLFGRVEVATNWNQIGSVYFKTTVSENFGCYCYVDPDRENLGVLLSCCVEVLLSYKRSRSPQWLEKQPNVTAATSL